jgi:hypothetical protein
VESALLHPVRQPQFPPDFGPKPADFMTKWEKTPEVARKEIINKDKFVLQINTNRERKHPQWPGSGREGDKG